MRYVFVSYVAIPEYSDPEAWLKRINAYTGILEALATTDTVISIEQISYTGSSLKNRVQYQFLQLSQSQRWFPRKLHHFIRGLKPDVVVVHSFLFPLQIMQLRLALGNKVKIIVQNHAEQPFERVKKQLQRLADIGVDAHLFASKAMGDGWVHRGNISTVQKVHEVMEVSSVFGPVNRAAALSKTGASGEPIFLWVCRLDPHKDPLTVVRAFLRYLPCRPGARLYMIYQTNALLEELRVLLNNNPCYRDHIKLIGKVPHADLIYWFNSADIFISGSHYEGSGTAVCEAMSCGCVPLVTDIDSFRMMTDNGKCGILYQPGNEEELLNALCALKHTDLEQKRALSLAHYQTTLSFGAIAERFREVARGLSK